MFAVLADEIGIGRAHFAFWRRICPAVRSMRGVELHVHGDGVKRRGPPATSKPKTRKIVAAKDPYAKLVGLAAEMAEAKLATKDSQRSLVVQRKKIACGLYL